jgi:Ca2+-binding RTX toxin-like protein
MLGGADDDSLTVKLSKSVPSGHIDGDDGEDVLRVLSYRWSSFLVDAGRGVIRATGRGTEATFGGFESYELDGPGSRQTPQSFRFLGTAAAEVLLMSRPGASVLRATMGGGDDFVRATYADDVIQAGAGEDTVRASSGRDVCRSVEHARDCELLSP